MLVAIETNLCGSPNKRGVDQDRGLGRFQSGEACSTGLLSSAAGTPIAARMDVIASKSALGIRVKRIYPAPSRTRAADRDVSQRPPIRSAFVGDSRYAELPSISTRKSIASIETRGFPLEPPGLRLPREQPKA